VSNQCGQGKANGTSDKLSLFSSPASRAICWPAQGRSCLSREDAKQRSPRILPGSLPSHRYLFSHIRLFAWTSFFYPCSFSFFASSRLRVEQIFPKFRSHVSTACFIQRREDVKARERRMREAAILPNAFGLEKEGGIGIIGYSGMSGRASREGWRSKTIFSSIASRSFSGQIETRPVRLTFISTSPVF